MPARPRRRGLAGDRRCDSAEDPDLTTAGWMNLAALIARPLFKWNHDIVMQQGGKGLGVPA